MRFGSPSGRCATGLSHNAFGDIPRFRGIVPGNSPLSSARTLRADAKWDFSGASWRGSRLRDGGGDQLLQDIQSQNKSRPLPLRFALYDHDPDCVHLELTRPFTSDAVLHLACPFEDLDGPQGLFEEAFQPLFSALPDLERRDTIVMAGPDAIGFQTRNAGTPTPSLNRGCSACK